jgi:hypothetical protein
MPSLLPPATIIGATRAWREGYPEGNQAPEFILYLRDQFLQT